MNPETIRISDYNYHLPAEKIAYDPLEKRDGSKLLIYKNGTIVEDHFYHLPQHLPNNTLLVLNDTKVIQARLLFQKESGGVIELFCLEPIGQTMELALQQTGFAKWKCLVGGASKWKPGQVLKKSVSVKNEVIEFTASYHSKLTDGFVIEFEWNYINIHFIDLLYAAGAVPLPPYIKRGAIETDSERYQTIFGKQEGSVAAPTAALHFTEGVFEQLKLQQIDPVFITLNVGAGTFKPVKTETIAEHVMHGEDFSVTIEVVKKLLVAERIIAVGTTSLRTIESLHWLGVKLLMNLMSEAWTIEQWEVYELDDTVSYKESLGAIINYMNANGLNALQCRTSLLIVPGYRFKLPSGLITNFHQPQSTLLLLIAAFIGDDWKKVYQYAMENNYRFLSYGDSSLLWRKTEA